jgi:hypothetical protein
MMECVAERVLGVVESMSLAASWHGHGVFAAGWGVLDKPREAEGPPFIERDSKSKIGLRESA